MKAQCFNSCTYKLHARRKNKIAAQSKDWSKSILNGVQPQKKTTKPFVCVKILKPTKGGKNNRLRTLKPDIMTCPCTTEQNLLPSKTSHGIK